MRAFAQKAACSQQSNTAQLARPASVQRATSPRNAFFAHNHGGFNFSEIPTHAPSAHPAALAIGNANDPSEKEAERAANRVMHMPEPRAQSGQVGAGSKPAVTRTAPGLSTSVSPVAIGETMAPAVVHDVLNSTGRPLDSATRAFMEPRFGRDFGGVRVHTGEKASLSARAMNAHAYTAGNNTVFAGGHYAPETSAGRRLLAHELAHVVQQACGGPQIIQRYEAGEHSQFGETSAELSARINEAQAKYTVGKGETPEFIAKAFVVPVEDLLARNKDKVKMFPLKGNKKKLVPGFAVGEVIEIPPVLNDAMKDALKQKELTYKAGKPDAQNNRATVRYGQGIAMGGDLYAKPDQIDNDSKANIENLGQMIDKEETGSKKSTKEFIDNADWDKATGGRFVPQALDNEAHFSPSNAAFAPATHSGSANNKTEWEKNHTLALTSSQASDKDKAFELNAFADHFLTDAFSAGHLINKLDVMEKFKSGITIEGTGPMTKDSKLSAASTSFFDQIANQAFTGDVATLYSQYETVEFKGGFFRPNIDSASRFSGLLQGIYTSEPDLIANSVSKSVHDDLNTKAGGVEVENNKGDKWPLSGDKTLNQKTLDIGRKAVAQSQFNVLSVFGAKDKLDLPKLFKAVWDFVPRPTTAGANVVKSSVDSGTDTKSASLVSSIVKMIRENYKLILDALVKRGILKKA